MMIPSTSNRYRRFDRVINFVSQLNKEAEERTVQEGRAKLGVSVSIEHQQKEWEISAWGRWRIQRGGVGG